MIYTEAEIEAEVSQCGGTWVKHRNLRNRLVKETNDEILSRIEAIRKEVRILKLDGFNEQDCRGLYSNITKLELRKL